MAQTVEAERKKDNGVLQSSFELVYGLNDRPPFWESLFVAFQHVFAVFVPIVTPPYVGYYVAVILAVLGLFPIVGGVLNTLPTSVLGGATILMFGAVAMAGINILLTVDFDRRSSMIVMLSLCAGVGVAYYPEIAQNLPDAAKSVLSSGIATGALMALFLNLVLPQESATPKSADLTEPENANL